MKTLFTLFAPMAALLRGGRGRHGHALPVGHQVVSMRAVSYVVRPGLALLIADWRATANSVAVW